MSIYIHGMELPSGCEGCFFLLDCGICSMLMAANCTQKTVGDYRWEENERHPDCPLIEVQPHGRLGDLDALERTYDQFRDCGAISPQSYTWVHIGISNADTIIPADPEGGDTK